MENINSTGTMGDLVSDLNSNFSESSIKEQADKVNSTTLSGTSVTPDGTTANFFNVMLTQNHTVINNIANMREGERYVIQTLQDAGGKSHVHWGTNTPNTGLTVSTSRAMGETIIITVDAGTFDWSAFSSIPQISNKIKITGLNENPMNCGQVVVDSFDESTGHIYISSPFASSISGESGTTGVSITVTSSNYFFPEEEDNWISTSPFGVTMFECWTSGGGMVSIRKIGIHTANPRYISKARLVQEVSDDFVGGDDNGILEWKESSINGAISSQSAEIDSNHQGIIGSRISGGSASARTCMRLQLNGFNITNMRSIVEFVHKLDSDFFEQVGTIVSCGWSDGDNNITEIKDGFFFELISNGDNSARLSCIVMNGSARTTYDTGIDIDGGEWLSFAIQIDSGYTHAHFYVNDIEVLKQDDITNFTANKLTSYFGIKHLGDALTGNKLMHTDMVSIKYKQNVDRI